MRAQITPLNDASSSDQFGPIKDKVPLLVVTRVIDNQFTHNIQPANFQSRPAVFVGKSRDPKKLEAVRHTHEATAPSSTEFLTGVNACI